MEHNISGISKKIWNIMRIAFFVIRKGICKRKLFMDLNMMMKRGKIAGKALGNIMFHHHNHHFFTSRGGVGESSDLSNDAPREYEFSCSNTPLYRQYFTNKLRKNHQHHQQNNQYYMPSSYPLEDGDQNVNLEEVNHMLEMKLRNEEANGGVSVTTLSPALPGLGFGQSPAVRQLRITDSPFPVQNVEEDKHVDEAAENFINNFYSQLKKQKHY